jgi:hypothetical protein
MWCGCTVAACASGIGFLPRPQGRANAELVRPPSGTSSLPVQHSPVLGAVQPIRHAHEWGCRRGKLDKGTWKRSSAHREGSVVIREDRELLAELARLNGDMASLGSRIMEGSASVIEQQNYAQRLIFAGERLRCRADELNHVVIEGEILVGKVTTLPSRTAEPA